MFLKTLTNRESPLQLTPTDPWFPGKILKTWETPLMIEITGLVLQCYSKDDTPHADRFHSSTFKSQTGNLYKPLEIKYEFRENKHVRRGRSSSDCLWTEINGGKKRYKDISPDFLVCHGHFSFPYVFPSPRFWFNRLHYRWGAPHSAMSGQDNPTCLISWSLDLNVSMFFF